VSGSAICGVWGGYHFDDLVADNVFDEAGCFGERFRDFAGDKHHLLDLDLVRVSFRPRQWPRTLYFLSLSCDIVTDPRTVVVRNPDHGESALFPDIAIPTGAFPKIVGS
jgi:hypothetical protein